VSLCRVAATVLRMKLVCDDAAKKRSCARTVDSASIRARCGGSRLALRPCPVDTRDDVVGELRNVAPDVLVHVIESLRRHFGHASFRAGQEELAFTPNFGSISSAQDSKQLQFAARFVF
jgi:hypothetical protein